MSRKFERPRSCRTCRLNGVSRSHAGTRHPAAILSKKAASTRPYPNIKARFADLGAAVLSGSSTDFEELIAEETEKWGNVVRAANLKAE
jgi:hypothetical protein